MPFATEISEFVSSLLHPAMPSLKEISNILLPVTGTLLGLIYAALTYWLQGGLERLEHTRDLLEDLLVARSKVLLDLLVGASLVSLFGALEVGALVRVSLAMSSLVLIVDLLRDTAEQGYLVTLNSNKFIPSSYGPTRKFWRKIWNAGPINWLFPLLYGLILVVYPVAVSRASGAALYSDLGASLFLVGAAALILVQIRSLLVTAFEARKLLEQRLMTAGTANAMTMSQDTPLLSDDQLRLDDLVLQETMASLGLETIEDISQRTQAGVSSRDLGELPAMMGPPAVKPDGRCHLNLLVPYVMDPEQLRQFVFLWNRRILCALANARVRVDHFTLSFFRNDVRGDNCHLALFRCTRATVGTLADRHPQDEAFARALEGKYLSEVISR